MASCKNMENSRTSVASGPLEAPWSFQESRWWGLFLYKGGRAAHASYVSGTEQLPLRRRRSKWPQIHAETWPPQLRIEKAGLWRSGYTGCASWMGLVTFLWRLEGTCSRLPPSWENRRCCLCGTGLHQTLNLLASLDLQNCQPNFCSWVCSSRLSGTRQMPRHRVTFLVITLEEWRRQYFRSRMLLKDESYWLFSRSWTYIEQLSGGRTHKNLIHVCLL